MRHLSLILSFALLLFLSSSAFGQNQDVVAYTTEKAEFDLAKSITVYPNPATDFINIKLSTLDASTAKISLYTILGNELAVEKENVDDHEVRIKVKDIAPGYYFIAVRDEQLHFKATYKVLKR
jgi:hypothetical protein